MDYYGKFIDSIVPFVKYVLKQRTKSVIKTGSIAPTDVERCPDTGEH